MKGGRQFPKIVETGGTAVAVVFDEPRLVRRGLLRDLEPPFPVAVDRDRASYARWGLGRASLRATYLSRRVWSEYVRLAARERRAPPWPGGDLRQLGGDFVIAVDGSIRLSRPQRDPAERSPVGELLEALAA